MGVQTIEKFKDWCTEHGKKPSDVNAILEYGGLRTALLLRQKI